MRLTPSGKPLPCGLDHLTRPFNFNVVIVLSGRMGVSEALAPPGGMRCGLSPPPEDLSEICSYPGITVSMPFLLSSRACRLAGTARTFSYCEKPVRNDSSEAFNNGSAPPQTASMYCLDHVSIGLGVPDETP